MICEGDDEWVTAAKYNIEQHLGDVAGGIEDPEELRNEVWTLAHDGAMDAGAIPMYAERIADQLSAGY